MDYNYKCDSRAVCVCVLLLCPYIGYVDFDGPMLSHSVAISLKGIEIFLGEQVPTDLILLLELKEKVSVNNNL